MHHQDCRFNCFCFDKKGLFSSPQTDRQTEGRQTSDRYNPNGYLHLFVLLLWVRWSTSLADYEVLSQGHLLDLLALLESFLNQLFQVIALLLFNFYLFGIFCLGILCSPTNFWFLFNGLNCFSNVKILLQFRIPSCWCSIFFIQFKPTTKNLFLVQQLVVLFLVAD